MKNSTTNQHEPHEKSNLVYKEECYAICGCIFIELKAVSKINNWHKAQIMNYLAATGYKLGLLVNFNSFPKAEIIRLVR